MVLPFKLSWPVRHSDSMNKEDVENTNRALSSLGLYKAPRLFVARFSNEPLVQGLKSFQRQQGLVRDGVMMPDGPTHRRLDEILTQQRPGRKTAQPLRQSRMGNGNTSKAEEGSDKDRVAAVPIPAIVYKVAEFFGMAVMAARAWWQSMSAAEQDKVRQQVGQGGSGNNSEADCDHLYFNVDIPVCDSIARRRGKHAAARCYASATQRYAACRSGVPIDQLPPLDVWNN